MRIGDGYGRFNGPTVDRDPTRCGDPPGTDRPTASGTTASATSGTDAVTLSSEAQRLADQAAAGGDSASVEQLRSL